MAVCFHILKGFANLKTASLLFLKWVLKFQALLLAKANFSYLHLASHWKHLILDLDLATAIGASDSLQIGRYPEASEVVLISKGVLD